MEMQSLICKTEFAKETTIMPSQASCKPRLCFVKRKDNIVLENGKEENFSCVAMRS
jgi:hypothetical protein